MKKQLNKIMLVFLALLMGAPLAYAAKDFNIKNNTQSFFYLSGSSGNVGLGTTTPQGGFVVNNGNVGIGTWTAAGGALIVSKGVGNVGIGSAWPGQLLDVQGTVRDIGQIVNGNVGIGTYALQTAFAVTNGNVGIGTWTAGGGALIVSNGIGNVGIGSAWPGQVLDVNGTARMTGFTLTGNGAATGEILITNGVGVGTWMAASTLPISGTIAGLTVNYVTKAATASSLTNSSIFDNGTNVGVGSGAPSAGLDVAGTIAAAGAGNSYFSVGNLGVGTTNPGQMLDVQGTVRSTGFTMSGQTPVSGYVMTASDSAGDTTWTSAGAAGGWTVSGNNVYETSSGNVGIGTFALQTALAVTNGNVGIGTWTAAGGNLIIKGGGNVGIGSAWPGQMLDVQGTVRDIGEIVNGNVGIGTSFVNGTGEGSLTVMNGNVGIGTWVPNQSLVVNGNVGIGTTTFLYGVAPNYLVFGTPNPTNYTGSQDFGTGVGDEIIIASNAGDPIINIGTQIYNGNGATTKLIADDGAAIGAGNTLGRLMFEGAPDASHGANAGNNAIILAIADQNFTDANMGTFLQFEVTPDNTTAPKVAMTIAATGNIGIGTSRPNSVLGIVGNIGIGTVGNGDNFLTTAPPNGGMIVEGSVGIGTWMPADIFQVGNYVSSTSGFVIDTNGNVGMGTTITSNGPLSVMSGNVGIGTWVPAYNFDMVNGTARQRNVRRVNTTAGASTPISINSDTTDLFTITAMAQASTINITAGTPNNGDLLEVRILDNGTARALTWGASGTGIASTSTILPATTVVSTTVRVLLEYDSAQGKWECIGVT